MAFATYSMVSLMMLLALLMLTTTALALKEADDHVTLPIQSFPSSELGSGSAKLEGLVDMSSPCFIQCGVMCLAGKASMMASPDKFSFGKIWRKTREGICISKCALGCKLIGQAKVKPEHYYCTLECVHKSTAKTKLTGSDAHTAWNNCYNKCEESYQGGIL